jgi:predicted ATPase
VGREDETAEAVRLLGRARLLTLTGAGGTGKSRLALHVAERLWPGYRDGAFFADLSTVTDPELVPSVLARALGVPEAPGRPVLEALCDHLRDRQLLLVVDNFEQVAAAGPVIEELLATAPEVRVLVTSRAAFALRSEQELVVPPLDLPDPRRPPDLDALGRSEAVRLFVERAQAVRPEFRLTTQNAPAVAEIAARLDGLPLAIELAATRTKILAPEQILPRLQRRLTLLTTGAGTLPGRQRTLRGAIAWSHDLLPDPERRLFARLSVFAGGWTFEAVEAVCDPTELGLDVLDGLTSLVDQSLVLRTEPTAGHPRFSMLETIHEFGQERLAEDGDLEQANLRAALRWAADAGQADRAQEAAGALWRFWQQRGHLTEGRRRHGPRPSPGPGGSPGGRRTSRPPRGSTRGRWPSSAGSAIPPGPPTRSTTRPSWWPPKATSRAPSGCSRRAWSCSGGPGSASASGTAWSGWPSSTPAPAARPAPGRPWRRPGRCSTTPTARWACSRSCSASPTWPDGRSATRTRCGWPGPRTPSATRSAAAPPRLPGRVPRRPGGRGPRPPPARCRAAGLAGGPHLRRGRGPGLVSSCRG